MSQLHVAFLTGQQQRFQRLLECSRTAGQSTAVSASLSSSGGGGKFTSNIDVNARDDQGRTVLHLACASLERSALECVRLLLGHPSIQINVQDAESHWTPLHRALYVGNIEAALLLLQRSDLDLQIKDYEGYTAFDLYNSTVEGTSPERDMPGDAYTWGTNRNSTLGHGDSDDRAYPDLMDLPPDDAKAKADVTRRFASAPVRSLVMARLHTAVLTAEPQRNLRLCGIASVGRLGPTQTASGALQIQYAMTPLAALPHNIAAIALGQDHSLAVTSAGEVFSWGSNRHGQLGYVIEGAPADMQAAPRKIAGGLRKEKVDGVAACRTASACWTSHGLVYTWGTNSGQLGYDRTSNQTIQVLPRRVTTLEEEVASVSLSDSAMVCLLRTSEVLCYTRDSHFKITFPLQGFPAGMASFQTIRKSSVVKIASCENSFVALSTWGEVFTFNLPTALDSDAGPKERANVVVKPQRVWDARKRFSTVKDVALGLDGAIILCTESGHVFMRQPSIKAAQGLSKPAKFQRVANLQRIVAVAASPTGSFGAIRVDARPEPVDIVGASFSEQIASVAPYWGTTPRPRKTLVPRSPPTVLGSGSVRIVFTPQAHVVTSRPTGDDEDDDDVDARVRRDVAVVTYLCEYLEKLRCLQKDKPKPTVSDHGGDVMVQVQGSNLQIPAHLVVLLARCPALRTVLAGTPARDAVGNVSVKSATATIMLSGVQPLAALVLLEYVYTDEVVLAWEPRVAMAVEVAYKHLKVRPAQLRGEVQSLARALGMEELERSLSRVFPSPAPSLSMALATAPSEFADVADVVLELKDRKIRVHSAVLRARSPFFAAFLDDPDWTALRRGRTHNDVLRVAMPHLAWREMNYIVRYLYADVVEDVFQDIDFVKSNNELIDFYFSVLSVADELLLEKLILICSSAILRRVNVWNACAILTDACMYYAVPLVRAVQGYIARNMETMLESHILDVLEHDVLKRLASAVRTNQLAKAPWVRSVEPLDALLAKWADWLEEQDIPGPLVRSSAMQRASRIGASPKLSPIQPGLGRRHSGGLRPSVSPLTSPTVVPTDYRAPGGDEIFEMDEEPQSALALPSPVSQTPVAGSPPAHAAPAAWKMATVPAAPKSGLREIMAETQSARARPVPGPSKMPSSDVLARGSPQDRSRLAQDNVVSTGAAGPAWRVAAAPPSTPLAGRAPRTPGSDGPSVRSPDSGGGVRVSPAPARPAAIPSPSAGLLSQTRPPAAVPRQSTGSPSVSRPAQNGTSTLGPTISPPPRRPPSPTLNIRRVSGQRGPAWAPAQPQVAPLTTSGVMSFAAIQQQERDRNAVPAKPKANLREIQAEEARREAERQQEEEFLRWWSAEEARIQAEEAEAIRLASGSASSKPAKKRNPKKKNMPARPANMELPAR
ncbi:hypothetical protein AURDEDRAFT_115340 [Auricularia subglabra TFB-10046 SS5]|nr:hypothetical protein AURDEDRAFT_115340 [Auricularia subglabra TFB-10046 SS5]